MSTQGWWQCPPRGGGAVLPSLRPRCSRRLGRISDSVCLQSLGSKSVRKPGCQLLLLSVPLLPLQPLQLQLSAPPPLDALRCPLPTSQQPLPLVPSLLPLACHFATSRRRRYRNRCGYCSRCCCYSCLPLALLPLQLRL